MEEELTEDEWETIDGLRGDLPFMAMNDSAREMLEKLVHGCGCQLGDYMRDLLSQVDLIESHNETSH